MSVRSSSYLDAVGSGTRREATETQNRLCSGKKADTKESASRFAYAKGLEDGKREEGNKESPALLTTLKGAAAKAESSFSLFDLVDLSGLDKQTPFETLCIKRMVVKSV